MTNRCRRFWYSQFLKCSFSFDNIQHCLRTIFHTVQRGDTIQIVTEFVWKNLFRATHSEANFVTVWVLSPTLDIHNSFSYYKRIVFVFWIGCDCCCTNWMKWTVYNIELRKFSSRTHHKILIIRSQRHLFNINFPAQNFLVRKHHLIFSICHCVVVLHEQKEKTNKQNLFTSTGFDCFFIC